jgi:hypothetical protein
MLVGVAAVIVWWNRKDMFTKERSIVEVIPTEKASDG